MTDKTRVFMLHTNDGEIKSINLPLCPLCDHGLCAEHIGNSRTKSQRLKVFCSNPKCRIERTDAAITNGIDYLISLQENKWQASRERYVPRPETLIQALRESDRHIEAIFTLGGCYRFVKLLQSFFDGVVPMINSRGDHAAAMIDGRLYDATGEIERAGFREALVADLIAMEEWSFDRHHMLSVGECPHCEEPISPATPKGGDGE